MIIKVNGKEQTFDEPLNISDLLRRMEIKHSMIVVEHNLHIVHKDDYDNTLIKENDSVEIVGFAGGG